MRNELILKKFEQPDQVTNFDKGKFEIINLGGITIGRGTYEPGLKWSDHVNPLENTKYCEVEHVCMVLSGAGTVVFEDGNKTNVLTGDLFYCPPKPHDFWVIGNEPYISLHFLRANKYAK